MASAKAAISKAVLLFSCPDARGIVAEVSQFIFTYSGNIVHSSQHNDAETGTFFMRVEWDLGEFQLARDQIGPSFEALARRFRMDWMLKFSDRRTRVAIFVSKYDHCLFDLLLRNKERELDAEIALIVSNHENLKHIADWFGIPFYWFPVTKENKHEVEKQEIELLQREEIDLVVLARYMQILTEQFVDAFPNRIINIHHSFLPAFVGARPYHQAFERGVKIIGATSHYVTARLDEGPIIEQDVTRITHRDSIQDLVSKGRNLERLVLSRAVELHLEHRVLVYRNKTVVFD
jgi:formyltetrahydrofolate deformylase